MTFAEWEALRKAGGGNDPGEAPAGAGSSILPSGLSMLGGLAGELAGPGGALAGTVIGSAADKIIDPLSKLIKGGVIGPLGSEGVGGAMADSAEGMVGDVAKNALINTLPGVVSAGLTKGGEALTKFGASAAAKASPLMRGAAGVMMDPLLKMLGVPSGVGEVAALAGPPAARAVGPAMKVAGEALPSSVLSGLRAAVGAMKPGVEEPFVPPDPADSVAATVRGARDNMDAGASRTEANQRAGWPLGKSSEVPYQAEPGAADTELFPYQKDAMQAGRQGRSVEALGRKLMTKDPIPDSLAALRSLGMSDTRLNELVAHFGGKQQ